MKKKVFSLLICSIIVFSSKAQGGMFENWAAGVNAGFYGFGIQGATSLTPNLKLRAGFDYLPLKYSKGIDFNAPVANAAVPSGTLPDIKGELKDLKLKFPNAKVLVDFYPMKDGIFCLTAGFYVGNNKIEANGIISNYGQIKDLLGGREPLFEFEDVTIDPRGGNFEATLKMGNVFKPYVGIGVGRTIANSRLGFKFELGMVYQGKYKVESPNIVKGAERFDNMAADFDWPVSKSLLNWWPMLNFALSYRIM